MTRPPDFDLTTVEGIVRTVEAMGRASMYTREAMYCAFWLRDRDDRDGYEYATEAAHHARRLWVVGQP